METSKINLYTAFLLGTVFLMASCVKDELYNTPHPTMGAVEITTDWSACAEQAVQPVSYTLRISGQSGQSYEQSVKGNTNLFHSLLAPADYELLVYNTPEDITISGDIAKVSSTGENNIEALPGYLFSATQALDVVRDDTLRTTVKMFQRIRQLTLILKLEEGDHDRITATSATLTGIAPSMNLKTGELPLTGGASLSPIFEKATSSDGLPTLVATFRLLGISMDEEQLLTVDVSLNNQTVQTIRTDLTSILHQQMTGSMAPLTLDATLSLPSEVEISAHITDWTIVENEDIDVH